MVTVAARAGPEFAATLKPTVPLPTPDAPEVMVIQFCDGVASQPHPGDVVTVIDVAAPPAAATDCEGGAIVVVHVPAWFTVWVWVPMLMVPVRPPPLFAVTENVTLPLPESAAPPVIVIHGVDVVAVQPQPPAADTEIADPLPAVAGSDCDWGLIDVAHDPGCVTGKVRPAMVRLPVRTLPVFAVAENPTVPLPLPPVPCVMVSHDVAVDAVQGQPAAMVTAIAGPWPPAAVRVALDGLSDGAHAGA